MNRFLFLSTLPLAILSFTGCSGSGGGAGGYPPAGEMRVVNSERIEMAVDTNNLIRNGDFRQWWAGAPAPNGFLPPGGATRLAKVPVGDTNAIAESWSAPDKPGDVAQMLRAESAPLSKDKSYELQITAAGATGSITTLSLWTKDQQGAWQLSDPDFIELQPSASALKTYRKTFVARSAGPVMIAASSNGTFSPDSSVIWAEWRLAAVGAGA